MHPQRLHDAFDRMSRREPPFDTLLRAKGPAGSDTIPYSSSFCACRAKLYTYSSPVWWATVPKEEWPEGLREAIAPLWHEPMATGNKNCTIGQHMDIPAIQAELQKCLLPEDEFKKGKANIGLNFRTRLLRKIRVVGNRCLQYRNSLAKTNVE